MNSSDQGPLSASNATSPREGEELVLWQGRPPVGIRFRMRHLAFLGMGLLLVLFFFAGNVGGAARGKRGNPPPLLVVIAVGAAGLIDLLWVDPWLRSRIRYVLTETQVIVEGDFFGGAVRRLDLSRIHDVEMWRKADDSGKLVLSAPSGTNEPRRQRRADAILDSSTFALGGKHYTDVVIGIEVDGGIKSLRELFNKAIREARERQSKA